MTDGNIERLAATAILDSSDPTRLTWKEIKDSWDTCSNFFYSYGLKPFNFEDCQEALEISRGIKSNAVEQEADEEQEEERHTAKPVSSTQNFGQTRLGGGSRRRSSQRKKN